MATEFRVRLCKREDDYCPDVVLKFDEGVVYIGEDQNMVKLTKDQWNILVEKVKEGQLTEMK
ncbi:MAG: hypothetical protein ACP5GD_03175 [Candidatus Micrarchaeia archaeon]|jgi:hypothetical protein